MKQYTIGVEYVYKNNYYKVFSVEAEDDESAKDIVQERADRITDGNDMFDKT